MNQCHETGNQGNRTIITHQKTNNQRPYSQPGRRQMKPLQNRGARRRTGAAQVSVQAEIMFKIQLLNDPMVDETFPKLRSVLLRSVLHRCCTGLSAGKNYVQNRTAR